MTIKVRPSGWDQSFRGAKAGAVFYLDVNGLQYSPELRQNPPRFRLLEDGQDGGLHTECELLDPWPDAPEYWPPWSAPGDTLVARALAAAAASPPAKPQPAKPSPPAPPAKPAKPPPRRQRGAAKATEGEPPTESDETP